MLCAPLLAALRAAYPGVRLTMAGQAGAVSLLHASGLLDCALGQDDQRLLGLFAESGPGFELATTLGVVDVAVGWLADHEGRVLRSLRRLARGRAVVAPSRPPPGSGLQVPAFLAGTLALVEIGPLTLPGPPLLTAPRAEQAWASDYLSSLSGEARPIVALHPGSGSPAKNWHALGYAAVLGALAEEYSVVLVAGPADSQALAAIEARTTARVVFARDLPLPRLAALLAACTALVGNDSGIGHLAALLGLPVVSLFGPTESALWRPWGERVRVLSWRAGHETLTPPEVVATVQQLLVGAARRH